MSEYDFGLEDDDQGEPQIQGDPDPKGFRKWMNEVSGTLKELREENARLQAETSKQAVKDALTKQGYAPQVADLYQGKPEGLNDWLGTYGAGLAKVDGGAVEPGQGVQGTPQSTVSPEDQAAMARMAAAGQDGQASGLSADDQLTARLNAATTMEELDSVMREAGSRYF